MTDRQTMSWLVHIGRQTNVIEENQVRATASGRDRE